MTFEPHGYLALFGRRMQTTLNCNEMNAEMMLKIVPGIVKQLRASDVCSTSLAFHKGRKGSALSLLKFISFLKNKSNTSVTKVKVNQSRYRPGVAQRVPGS